MNIKVAEKHVYGRPLYYPGCPLSRAISGIKGGKTLSGEELDALRRGGLSCIVTDEKGEVVEYPATGESGA